MFEIKPSRLESLAVGQNCMHCLKVSFFSCMGDVIEWGPKHIAAGPKLCYFKQTIAVLVKMCGVTRED